MRDVFLLLLIAAIWLSSSHALTLCVHEERVGFEPAWATCCETAPCCEATSAPAPARHHESASAADGCRDFVLTLGDEWTPDERQPLLRADLGLSSLPACAPWRWPAARALPPGLLLGVPPPQRAQRSPILRC